MHEFSKTLYEEAAKKRAAEQPQAAPGGDAPDPGAGAKPKGKSGSSEGDEKIIDADFKTK